MLTPLAPLTLAFELSKIDEERRYVGGYATVEELDKQHDIIDYEASVKAFSEWPGNIREMHDAKKAVGTAIEVRPEPDTKRVWLGCRISKSKDGEDTWTKVREGVLKGFSIKGVVLDSKPETVQMGEGPIHANRVTAYRLDEVSLVDNPACPSALISVVKSVEGQSVATDVLEVPEQPRVAGGLTSNVAATTVTTQPAKAPTNAAAGLQKGLPARAQTSAPPAGPHGLGGVTLGARNTNPQLALRMAQMRSGILEKVDQVDVDRLAGALKELTELVAANPGDPSLQPLVAAIQSLGQAIGQAGSAAAPVPPAPAPDMAHRGR